ncbi:MAG: prepilin peptidase [Myxococcales bacterium]|nr:prepilin peptidase [Myxococcales bacterium]
MAWDARDVVMAALLGVACYTDITTGKIKNWLTFPAMVAGVILAPIAAPHWWDGAAGLVAALGLGVVLWKFGGAYRPGDVKLVMAAGAVGGPELILRGMLIGFLFNFPFALVVLAVKGRLGHFLRFCAALIRAVVRRQPMKTFMSEWDAKTTVVPFGPVIAAGIVVARLHPWPDLW